METKNFQKNPIVQKHRWVILIAVGLFTFMSTLDSSIVNIALPTISKDIHAPMNQATWMVSVYLMVVCACLLLFGKIGDSYGKIKVFKIGTFIFILGSFLCGIPHSLEFLLFARTVQAVGASMTMSTNTGIITEVFPLHERGKALGLIGSFVSLGSIAGPGIGGLILSKFTWSYIFWINVPVGIFTIILGMLFLPNDVLKSKKKIDLTGFISFAFFILTLFGGIFIGQEIGFAKPLSLGLFLLAFISFMIFFSLERKNVNALVSFKLFKNKMFTISLLTAMMIFATNFFSNVIFPYYLQDAKAYSASFSGLLMMVFPVVMMVGAPFSGALSDKIGPNSLTLVGLILLTVSQFFFIFLNLGSSLIYFVFLTACMGLGNALFQAPNNTIVMSCVEKKDLGVAGSLNSLARNFGMVVGIALSTTILYQAMSWKMGEKVTTYIESRPDVFIYGMNSAFLGSFTICMIATFLTGYRLFKNSKKVQDGVK